MPEISSSVTFQVPGSTSNLGPGFDCLGIALGMQNRVTVTRTERSISPPHGMVSEAARLFFRRTRTAQFGFDWEIVGDVPISMGLGSSVTVRLGILAALNELSGCPLSQDGLFALCTELEGHPDNAGPAAFGGFVLSTPKGEYFRFPVGEELKFILLLPEQQILTESARRVLPANVPLRECAMNMSYACAITAAFATGQYERLRDHFEDFLHQRYRAHLVPGLYEVIQAGTNAGGLGGFLSGSGSAICGVTLAGNENAVATAMRQAYPDPTRCGLRIVTADNNGTSIVTTA